MLIPLLLGLGGIGVLGAQLLGEDKVIGAAEDFGEAGRACHGGDGQWRLLYSKSCIP